MTDSSPPKTMTRRDLLKDSGRLTAATSLLATSPLSAFHGGADDTIRLAVVGCGGRGSGAVTNALSVKRGPIKLVAMADVFEDRLKSSYTAITRNFADQVDVPDERKFIGFDGYKSAIDCLGPGDIVIFATPPAFRWVHFQYAIEKGLHVFMEKPVTVDGPSSRRMLELAKKAEAKNLKVGVGLMARHSRAFQELVERVREGQLGEIISQFGYRMQGPIVTFRSLPKPDNVSELEYQIRRFHSFLWASGGGYSDFFIHIIDQLCWMKGEWPVKAQGFGGRHHRRSKDGVPYIDQNLDSYGIEYTYADGTKFMFEGRNMEGCETRFSSYMHGTKASAIVSSSSDCGLPSSIHYRRDFSRDSMVWRSKVKDEERNPYQNEWEDLMDAIRDDKPFNEVKRGVEASLVCSMGRMAAHTGQPVSFDKMLQCPHEFAPKVAELTLDSEAPVTADENGLYPIPQPGIIIDREY